MFRKFAFCLALLAASTAAEAQTFKNLTHQPPDGAVVTFQMTDGTVVAQGFNYDDWWKLTPDIMGSYVNGTWSRIADLPSNYAPYAQAESVLADGRLLISGGEYNFGVFAFTNLGAIYDPKTNSWKNLPPPKGWPNIGDSPGNVMSDGRYLLGYKFKTKMAIWDPATEQWSKVGSKNKQGMQAEEGWVLLPDNSVLTVDVKAHPGSERYLLDKGKWVSAGSTIVDLRGPQNCCGRCIEVPPKNKCYDPPGETGAAVLLPDGRVFATGAAPDGENHGHTSVWTPPSHGDKTGHWTPGPDFPNGDEGYDTPVSILPSGHVLVEGSSGTLYEYDGTALVRKSFNAAGGGLMPLPTGEVLVGGFAVYQPTGTYDAAWAPAIDDAPSTVTRGQSYTVGGTQFNGLNQGAAFGDELDTHTNYPLVRIVNNATNHVFYARTHDHSSMGVATGAKPVSTHFDVPATMETGASKLYVVANGIPSVPVNVTVN